MKFEEMINSEEKVKSFIILMILGIIIAVVIGIYSLIKIWMPSGDLAIVDDTLALGKYEYTKISEEDMAKTYFSKIFVYMYNEDYEQLYKMLDPLYVEETNMTVDKLREYIQNKGINIVDLVLEKYQVDKKEGYKVYTLQLNVIDGSKMEKVIVKEKSPKHITISFGETLYQEDTGNKALKDGLEYECTSIEDAGTQITVKVKITNVSTDKVVINKNKEIFAIKGITDKNKIINSLSDTVNSKVIELSPQQTFTYVGVFRKDDYNTIKGIQIESLYNPTTDINVTSVYEF